MLEVNEDSVITSCSSQKNDFGVGDCLDSNSLEIRVSR